MKIQNELKTPIVIHLNTLLIKNDRIAILHNLNGLARINFWAEHERYRAKFVEKIRPDVYFIDYDLGT